MKFYLWQRGSERSEEDQSVEQRAAHRPREMPGRPGGRLGGKYFNLLRNYNQFEEYLGRRFF